MHIKQLILICRFNTCWKSHQNPTDGAKNPQGRLSPPIICLAAKNWTIQNRREALFVGGAGDGFKTAWLYLLKTAIPACIRLLLKDWRINTKVSNFDRGKYVWLDRKDTDLELCIHSTTILCENGNIILIEIDL